MELKWGLSLPIPIYEVKHVKCIVGTVGLPPQQRASEETSVRNTARGC